MKVRSDSEPLSGMEKPTYLHLDGMARENELSYNKACKVGRYSGGDIPPGCKITIRNYNPNSSGAHMADYENRNIRLECDYLGKL